MSLSIIELKLKFPRVWDCASVTVTGSMPEILCIRFVDQRLLSGCATFTLVNFLLDVVTLACLIDGLYQVFILAVVKNMTHDKLTSEFLMCS